MVKVDVEIEVKKDVNMEDRGTSDIHGKSNEYYRNQDGLTMNRVLVQIIVILRIQN